MFSLFKPETKSEVSAAPVRSERRVVAPRVDILETDDAVLLIADMPGVSADSIDVRVHGDVLTLRGTTRLEEPRSFQVIWREYALRDYERTFRLGHAIDTERITAQAKDGVVRVTLPKRAAAQAKRIAVTAG
ncbi:MAG: Hsp20/alpha crystallin family protein [Planctomycetota bacterium]|nr:Hsp20/alpha crystallin family protein [Planctomycetota bacterium]MCX8040198.1 Hsp20/alpha crystallin family protein [Planctomycetota bacterium]MDW8372507.1 Hsp20/alpha crystallin family protein [Planctomycetota bacterium]